ncbi:hypothetical protein ACHAWU_003052 [Discostella pseudostelligera]|uniref:Uncharacterized protein n=1 Tax=Discostella pseudostelligera TaxID=259834 RepID=A0ABD3M8B7_9STRA
MTMAAATTVASAAATALYKYTYTLGRSLYVPITSRCNSIPLPVTRGPGFILPQSVATSLLHVRNDEVPNYNVGSGYWNNWLVKNVSEEEVEEEEMMVGDGRVEVPPYNLPLVNSLYEFHYGDIPRHLQRRREIFGSVIPNTTDDDDENPKQVLDDRLQPSIESLVNEVTTRLRNQVVSEENYSQVVIAGEGEPTLRMDALLAVARSVKSFNKQQHRAANKHAPTSKHSKDASSSSPPPPISVRVVTNGLCYGIPNLGYSPYNSERDGVLVPMHRHVILRDMIEAGVSRLSVALNTANRHEYDVLMEPTCHTGGGGGGNNHFSDDDAGQARGSGSGSRSSSAGAESPLFLPGVAHDIVCEFIMETAKLGMDVEITGIDRPDIDKVEMERLARLLLSVRPRKEQKRRMIRWRRYFD